MSAVSLFIASFLAATLLPGGSEALLLLMINDTPTQAITLFIVASAGNSLGSISSYGLGYVGRLSLNKQQLSSRSAQFITRYGYWSLLFSWLPLVGDVLCVVAGYFKLPLLPCVILITVGKTLRYALLVYMFT